jgi:tetratricopeptide (TPR) repeat protein
LQSTKQKAIKHLKIAIENDKRHLPSVIALCEILSQDGKYDEAETILRETIGNNCESSELYFSISKIYLKMGKFIESLRSIDKAITLDPNKSKLYKLGSEIHHANQQAHLSIPYLEKLIEIDGLDGEAHFKLSTLLTDYNDIQRRKLLLEISTDLMPKNVLPIMELALFLIDIANEPTCEKVDKEKYIKETEKLFLQITKINPKLGKPWYYLGVLNFNKNKIKEAEEFLCKSLEFDDSKGMSAYKLGTICLQKKIFPAAEKYFEISLEHKTKKSNSLFEIALIQLSKKMHKNAIQILEKAIKEVTKEEVHYYTKSEEYLKLSNFDFARKYLKKGINSKRLHSKILVKLYQAKKYLDLNQNEESELKKAIELDSANYEPYFELGMVYLKEKKLEEAKSNFSLACNNNWSHAESHFNLGQILSKSKDGESAIMHFQIVLDLNKSHKMAAKLLKKCLATN